MTSTDPTTPVADYPEIDDLLRELDEHGVLLLTLNRPQRNNGWTFALEDAYFASLIAAANDPAVRAIVVTGAGRSFCPGLDMQILEESARQGTPGGLYRRWPMTTARLIPKPIIAAVNGACAGIGFVQMASCDLAFASTAAKFTTAFARRGLPAEESRLRSLVLMSEMGIHPDFLEGVTSFREKRQPSFGGLDARLHIERSINR